MDGTQWGDKWETIGDGWDTMGKGWDTIGGQMGHDEGTHGTP